MPEAQTLSYDEENRQKYQYRSFVEFFADEHLGFLPDDGQRSFVVHQEFLENEFRQLNTAARRVFFTLARFASKNEVRHVDQLTLAGLSGYRRANSIRDALKRLSEMGIIEIIQGQKSRSLNGKFSSDRTQYRFTRYPPNDDMRSLNEKNISFGAFPKAVIDNGQWAVMGDALRSVYLWALGSSKRFIPEQHYRDAKDFNTQIDAKRYHRIAPIPSRLFFRQFGHDPASIKRALEKIPRLDSLESTQWSNDWGAGVAMKYGGVDYARSLISEVDSFFPMWAWNDSLVLLDYGCRVPCCEGLEIVSNGNWFYHCDWVDGNVFMIDKIVFLVKSPRIHFPQVLDMLQERDFNYRRQKQLEPIVAQQIRTAGDLVGRRLLKDGAVFQIKEMDSGLVAVSESEEIDSFPMDKRPQYKFQYIKMINDFIVSKAQSA